MSEALYHEAIKRLANETRGRGKLQSPAGSALLDNALCGDRVRMQVNLDGGAIAALAHEVKGCLLCRAAAGVLSARAPGRRADEIMPVTAGLEAMLRGEASVPGGWPELEVFEPVRAHRSRHGCVLLPFQALLAALEDAARGALDPRK